MEEFGQSAGCPGREPREPRWHSARVLVPKRCTSDTSLPCNLHLHWALSPSTATMPPLPSTLSAEVQASIASLQRKQTDLENFQIPRLRTCKGPLSTQQQFASELREDVDTFARDLDKLSLAVDDQRGERNRRELASIVDNFKGVLAGCVLPLPSSLLC